MNGPSQGFLQNIWAPFNDAAAREGYGQVPAPAAPVVSIAGQPPAPPPPMLALPGDAPVAPPPPAVQSQPPPAPGPHVDEARMMSVAEPTASQGPAPAPSPPAGPPPPRVPPGPTQFPLVGVGGGGVVPAHEFDRRGPSLKAAQGARNLASEQTIERVNERGQDMAEQEYALALDQERQARAREAAAQQSMAERDEELAQRQADFDSTVKQLGKMGSIDRDRFWASRSTAQKVAGIAELMLSGFRGAPSLLMKRIDDDVKAQEFAFYATRDTAQAKQTAFAMAMQKYQNVDAARALAKAAALDVTQAQMAQASAKWKGTETANRADMAMAALQDEKMMQIANGIQFIPPQYQGRRFIDPRTGLVYSEAEAKAMSAKVDERAFNAQQQTAGIGGQLMVEEAKERMKHDAASGQRLVPGMQVGTMPDGTPVRLSPYVAQTVEEAKEAREARKAGAELVDMIDRVMAIREEGAIGGRTGRFLSQAVPWNLQWENEVKALAPQIGIAWSKTKKLGTYDKGVENLIGQIQGDPTAVLRGTDEKLEMLRSMVLNGMASEQESQGSEPRRPTSFRPGWSEDAMPASFTPHGKK